MTKTLRYALLLMAFALPMSMQAQNSHHGNGHHGHGNGLCDSTGVCDSTGHHGNGHHGHGNHHFCDSTCVSDSTFTGDKGDQPGTVGINNASNNARIFCTQGNIVILNAEGLTVSVHDISGRHITTQRNIPADLRITLPHKGVYIVRCGSTTTKVLAR